jgi:hypothetical protein
MTRVERHTPLVSRPSGDDEMQSCASASRHSRAHVPCVGWPTMSMSRSGAGEPRTRSPRCQQSESANKISILARFLTWHASCSRQFVMVPMHDGFDALRRLASSVERPLQRTHRARQSCRTCAVREQRSGDALTAARGITCTPPGIRRSQMHSAADEKHRPAVRENAPCGELSDGSHAEHNAGLL